MRCDPRTPTRGVAEGKLKMNVGRGSLREWKAVMDPLAEYKVALLNPL